MLLLPLFWSVEAVIVTFAFIGVVAPLKELFNTVIVSAELAVMQLAPALTT